MSNSNDDMFMVATRLNLRFPVPANQTPQGQLTVQDLWQLPLTATGNRVSLESIAAELQQKLAAMPTSILRRGAVSSPERQKTELALNIVVRVAEVLQDEADAKTLAAAKASERSRLQKMLEEKREANMSEADIERKLAALDAAANKLVTSST